MKNKLEENGFIKVNELDRWFISFQGRTYYIYQDGGYWWVLINKNGTDIKINQVGYDDFEQIENLLNSITLNKIFKQ